MRTLVEPQKSRDASFSPTLSLKISGGPTSDSRKKHRASGEADGSGTPQPRLPASTLVKEDQLRAGSCAPSPTSGLVRSESIRAHSLAAKRDQRRVHLRDGTPNLKPIPQLNLLNLGNFVRSRIASRFDARGIVDPTPPCPNPSLLRCPKGVSAKARVFSTDLGH